MKKKRIKKRMTVELSVEQTAARMGVSGRTVLNYIKARKISAVKVAKKWYVDQPSVEALAQQTGLTLRAPGSTVDIEADRFFLESLKTSANKKSPENLSGEKKIYSPHKLACYRLCLEAFEMPLWKVVEKGENGGAGADSLRRLKSIKYQILEALGAGFYSYSAQKNIFYMKARSLLGGALGILYSDARLIASWREDILFLETALMPALTSLIRKIERGRDKNRPAG